MLADIESGQVAAKLRRAGAVLLFVAFLAASAAKSSQLAHAAGEAKVAGVQSLREHGSLRITKNNGSSIEARGRVSGTLSGALSLRVIVKSAEKLGASLIGTSSAGALSGSGSATYGVAGSGLSYRGTVSITHGTGKYSHASGGGIRIEGVMNRQQETITLNIDGQFNT